jgi:hypothetical protein
MGAGGVREREERVGRAPDEERRNLDALQLRREVPGAEKRLPLRQRAHRGQVRLRVAVLGVHLAQVLEILVVHGLSQV